MHSENLSTLTMSLSQLDPLKRERENKTLESIMTVNEKEKERAIEHAIALVNNEHIYLRERSF